MLMAAEPSFNSRQDQFCWSLMLFLERGRLWSMTAELPARYLRLYFPQQDTSGCNPTGRVPPCHVNCPTFLPWDLKEFFFLLLWKWDCIICVGLLLPQKVEYVLQSLVGKEMGSHLCFYLPPFSNYHTHKHLKYWLVLFVLYKQAGKLCLTSVPVAHASASPLVHQVAAHPCFKYLSALLETSTVQVSVGAYCWQSFLSQHLLLTVVSLW